MGSLPRSSSSRSTGSRSPSFRRIPTVPTDELRILVIDDSDDDCMLYRRALQRSADTRSRIPEASEGRGGPQRLAQEGPACVLLDYSLPGRNGVEVLKCIRTHHPFV